ncbi:MAG: ABC transporter permease [Eubacteriaceae bacterium]
MKQLLTILKFEYLNYAKNKIFIGITLGIVILIGLGLSLPRFNQFINFDALFKEEDHQATVAIVDRYSNQPDQTLAYFKKTIPNKTFVLVDQSKESLIDNVNQDVYKEGLILYSPTKYDYIVKTLEMMNTFQYEINAIITSKYQLDMLTAFGLSSEESTTILSPKVEGEVIQTGKDQAKNFLYTYLMIFLLYIVIIMYGQFVSTSVASEKSTRTMEVLITSAKPINLIFGKVFGAGLAGLTQVILILGSSFFFFNLNKIFWESNGMVESIFNMPLSTIFYSILFFILGYFIYSFIYGALGSLVSKTEDLGTATMPVTLVFVACFMVVMFSMSSGNLNTPLMIFASYFPLSSPMAMLVRITMGEVSALEIIISCVILVVSCFVVAYYSAKVYKMGILHYGKSLKFSKILKQK